MRRFFRAHSYSDEDNSQIQYLTAKCNRLTHEKVVLERECMGARERERSLQNELEALSTQLCQQEQVNIDLMFKHDQMLGRVHHEQQRVHLVVEESFRDAALLGLQLEQVNSELLHLQSSEVQLEGLVEELHTKDLQRAALTEDLQVQLHSKVLELEELQCGYAANTQELEELRSANQRKVQGLQRENECSLKKLQETAAQFEWLCEQQRYWMCCVKRFKDCLSEEKDSLVQQVKRLEKEVAELRKSSESTTQMLCCPLEDTVSQHCDRMPSWESGKMADLQTQVDKWRKLYEDLFSQFTPHQGGHVVDGYQKPP
ncbi:hyaluronan mediated motility receptor isoform X3 [Oncorhynchus tshawytscha]|uniref:hyaluronan mediated motility receptor isoform X3 n=1 Tax=Oncorhynchus tshawytscha TaxID=74940 RepID=UPI000D0A4484|nr:hyaluronan mediated motility receptor isoform X3 [Oncorhynchus tshawytscha]